jgi:hypothetical protein
MKNETMGKLNPVNKNDLQDLLKETKETLATNVKIVSNQPVFGSVDLWNAQKRQRTSLTMRRNFNLS